MSNLCSKNCILNNNTSRSVPKSDVLPNVKAEFVGKVVEFSDSPQKPKILLKEESTKKWEIADPHPEKFNTPTAIIQAKVSLNNGELVKLPVIPEFLDDRQFLKMPKFVEEPKHLKMPNFVKMAKLANMPKFANKPSLIQMSKLANIPRLVSNYIASFLDTKKELFWLALILNRCSKNTTKFQLHLFTIEDFHEKEELDQVRDWIFQPTDKVHGFWTIAMKLKFMDEWALMLNWLKDNLEFCEKVHEIEESPNVNDDDRGLVQIFSLCKSLYRLKVGHISWKGIDQFEISHGLESLELTSFSSELNPLTIKKIFPKLKFLKVHLQLSFYEDKEFINEETKVFSELTKKYIGVSIQLRFNKNQIDAVINWCKQNTELLQNVSVLNGSVCPLNKANKNAWLWLVKNIVNTDILLVGSINTPCLLIAEKSKIRQILIFHGMSKNLTLKNLPELESLRCEGIKKSVTITLSGVPKLNNINGEIKRPLMAIEINKNEKKIRQCKVVDEDFLTK